MEKLKIVFVGIPDMATVCLDKLTKSGFDIVSVIPPKKSHETYNAFKNFVEYKNLKLIEFNESINEENCINEIKKLNADIGVVCSYNQKLSSDFLKTTRLGYINAHPSLLPDYRGGMPYFHIINNNEKKSGITLHFMDETFDTGDIIYQEEIELLNSETMGTLFNRTTFMIADALVKVLSDIQNGKEIKRIKQNKEGNFKKANSVHGVFKVNFSDEVEKIDSLIRACNPFYNAYCYFRGVNLRIIKAKKIDKKHNFEYGKIVKANKKELFIAAKSGLISLEVVQVGTWGIFCPSDFYDFFSPTTDEVLQ